jgi:tRNA U34 5-carboxymethylaminomethyl modifying enzyme MnmG/GidA
MWRKAWIEDDYIVVHCCLDEIKKYHLKDIKEDVLKSNIKYKLYIKQEKDKRKKMKEKETQERKQINDAFDGIEF